MKGRESGMPEENIWDDFFDADCIIKKLVCDFLEHGDVVEFGTGYGTFTLPVAKMISGRIFSFDIEPELIALVKKKAIDLNFSNVTLTCRDFVENGTGLPPGSFTHAMLYNILHIESPITLLSEAYRLLKPGGTASIIHWRSEIPTPRGPSLEIRPDLEQCRAWAESAGFKFLKEIDLSGCCQYHYGFVVAHAG